MSTHFGKENPLVRLANAVMARRMNLGIRSNIELGKKVGLTPRSIGDLMNGRRRLSSESDAKIEKALGFDPGEFDRIFNGRDEITKPLLARLKSLENRVADLEAVIRLLGKPTPS